jgi:hypothetical protein
MEPGSLGFWCAINRDEVERFKQRSDAMLAEAIYGIAAVADEAGPARLSAPRSLAARELQRLRLLSINRQSRATFSQTPPG